MNNTATTTPTQSDFDTIVDGFWSAWDAFEAVAPTATVAMAKRQTLRLSIVESTRMLNLYTALIVS